MTSWERIKAYAKQRNQDPYGEVVITERQARRYIKKWKREFGDEAWKRHLEDLSEY